MDRRVKDITGNQYGRLTVLGLSHTKDMRSYWMCACVCGTTKAIRKEGLLNGKVQSCGCLKKELDANMRTNGCRQHPGAYASWQRMIDRCTNPRASNFKYYGGRGISVAARWMKFENFVSDMGDRPHNGSIERVDVNGDYCPENCIWLDKSLQQRNTRRNAEVGVWEVEHE